MGISTIWMGFEGVHAGYEKMQGKSFKEIIEGCRQYGINVLTSMIIGFDYQKIETIDQEMDELFKLNPACAQFLIYGPGWVTPLRKRMEKEGRILDYYYSDFSHQDGFELYFKHPHIGKQEMESKLRECFTKEYEVLGPTVFRVLENALIGYRNNKNSDNRMLQYRNKEFCNMLKKSFLLRYIGWVFVPNKEVRQKIEKLFLEIEQEVGAPPFYFHILALFALLPALITKIRFRYNIGMQPPLGVKDYR